MGSFSCPPTTHSFEMFRQWIIQLEGAPKPLIGKHTIHELRIRHRSVAGDVRRVPILEPWPTDKKESGRLRSQYHFLFSQVADAVLKSEAGANLHEQLDILALAPNSARKMLEAFLSFKYPKQMGDFNGSMRAALDNIQDGPTRIRIVRYVHAYSHNEDGDLGKPLEPGEATAVLASVFHLIRALDPGHYESMCESLDLEPQTLYLAGTSSRG
jgi:hypothetical protein